MIVFDLINDEAPLFIKAVENLIVEGAVSIDGVLGITEGNRWQEESEVLQCRNRLHFFDDLDKSNIDVKKEIYRISQTYDGFNIYACDRYLIKKDRAYQKKMLVYTYLFYEQLFEQRVTHYFTTGIAFTYNMVSYQVSKRFGVKHISFYGIRLKNKSAVSYDAKNTFNEVDKAYEEFSPEKVNPEMFAPITAFLNKPKQPSYMKNAINASSIKGVFISEFFIRFNKFYFKKRHKYDLFTRNPFELSLFKLKKIVQAKKIGFFHNTIFDKTDLSENYFVFPLHMQPEASTLILAPYYVDQKTAIINISKCLPTHVQLYVKEHKSALGQHSFSFYKELKRHPKIRLVSYKENMFDLIKNSFGTINLSSTVGLESLLMKKPSIVLGDVFYNSSKLTYTVESFKELQKLTNKIVSKEYDLNMEFKNYDEKLAFYINCLFDNSFNFEFNVAKLDTKERVLKTENVSVMSKCIKKQIMK
ncbi:hypothetical protein [Ulvibacterium sp.]|uniref:capsular polysaccharide export protein, LipB/KpsS family n=1 Tax=Ulvibacterium sp. TaxID=2665914 RepID=UPI003BA87B6D